jgi:tRNA threonylcarbamoyladenosine biosynthesis protein TsaB
MNILAFDTCFGAVSAAVRRQSLLGEWVQHEAFEMHGGGGNAERLFEVITHVLEESGLDLEDVDRFAVTLGPGTFTGLRVGTSAVRGLALATGKPVVGTSSLSVIAEQARRLAPALNAAHLVVAMDARRGALYVQQFAPDRSQLTEAALLSPEGAAQRICATIIHGSETSVVGSGAETVADAMRACGRAARVMLTEIQPHAGALALMAPHLTPLTTLAPIYLRQPDAKEPAKPPQHLAAQS